MDLHDAWAQKCSELPPKPTFEEFCGLSREQVITRFERQIGAQEIKGVYRPGDARKLPIFSTLEELRENAADWNPYVAVDFAPDGTVPDLPFDSPLPSMLDYSLTEYMAGLHYRDRVRAQGRQLADVWVRRHSRGHGKDILARLEKFAPLATDSCAVRLTRGELYERYRAAIEKQIAA